MPKDVIRILSMSDQIVDRIYSDHVKNMFSDVDLILSCGDLPYYYLEYVLDTLNVPMYFVHGNHDPEVEIGEHGDRDQPWGAENIHGRVVDHLGVVILGFEGSIRYSSAKHQYTQIEVWLQVLQIVPRLFLNRLLRGRFLDILVTHSPAKGLGDADDQAHTGFNAYRWLIKVFKPRYHLHGHVHNYGENVRKQQKYLETQIINVSPFQKLDFRKGAHNE